MLGVMLEVKNNLRICLQFAEFADSADSFLIPLTVADSSSA